MGNKLTAPRTEFLKGDVDLNVTRLEWDADADTSIKVERVREHYTTGSALAWTEWTVLEPHRFVSNIYRFDDSDPEHSTRVFFLLERGDTVFTRDK